MIKVTLKHRTCTVQGIQFRAYADGMLERWISNRWREVRGNPNSDGHLRVFINYKYIFYHRIIYQAYHPEWDINDRSQIIDHIDRNKANNAITNLRIVTKSENAMNRTRISEKKYDLPKNITPEYKSNVDRWYWCINVRVNGKNYGRAISAGNGRIPDPLPPVPPNILKVRDDFVALHHGSYAA